VNPLVSIVLGVALFNDTLRDSAAAIIVEVVAIAVMMLGAVWLATSPLLAGIHDDSAGNHLLAGRGRIARFRAKRRLTNAN